MNAIAFQVSRIQHLLNHRRGQGHGRGYIIIVNIMMPSIVDVECYTPSCAEFAFDRSVCFINSSVLQVAT